MKYCVRRPQTETNQQTTTVFFGQSGIIEERNELLPQNF